jgi:hypothetical protein
LIPNDSEGAVNSGFRNARRSALDRSIAVPNVRQNTRLESEGAEFLVLGNLLVEGVSCFKAYTNFQGYDLVAVNPETGKTARIQVKSRWATDYDGSFPIKNYDCDFVVHVALNRGYRFRKKASNEVGRKDPEFYVFPVSAVKAARNPKSAWGKTRIQNIPDWQAFRSNWTLVADFLRG